MNDDTRISSCVRCEGEGLVLGGVVDGYTSVHLCPDCQGPGAATRVRCSCGADTSHTEQHGKRLHNMTVRAEAAERSFGAARVEVARLRHLAERAISPFMCSENCAHNADYTQKEALHDLEAYLRETLAEEASR